MHALAAAMLLSIASDRHRAGERPGAAPTKEGQAANAAGLRLTGKVDVSSVDDDGDGLLEAAVVHVELEVLTAGEYSLSGTLAKGGRAVSNRRSWHSARPFSNSTFSAAPGIHRASLAFSGEEIFRSGQDGPYDLELFAVGATGSAVLKVQTPFLDHRKFGELGAGITGATETAIDEDGDGRLDALRVTADVAVRVAGRYRLDASIRKGGTTLATVTPELFSLTPGARTLELRAPGLPLLRSGLDGPYEGTVSLSDQRAGNLGFAEFMSRAYAAAAFEPFLQTDGRFKDRGIDTNGNGLLDLLRIELAAAVDKPGSYLLSGEVWEVTSATSARQVSAETRVSFTRSPQTITLDFSGNVIRDQGIDGPYEVEIVVQDSATHDELDRLRLGGLAPSGPGQRTAAYRHTDFEPFDWAPIRVTGVATDRGIDSDGNGLFEELRVEVEVELVQTDIYEWQAILEDAHGTNIDWDLGRATLPAGKATIAFTFEGKKIRQNGVDGPYSVERMAMSGNKGPNIEVPSSIAQAQVYAFFSFE